MPARWVTAGLACLAASCTAAPLPIPTATSVTLPDLIVTHIAPAGDSKLSKAHPAGSRLVDVADELRRKRVQRARRNGARFDIVINYVSSVTSSQRRAFEAAELVWETLVAGVSTAGHSGQVVIDASIVPIDGRFGTLGMAGPTAAANGLTVSAGIMQFDTADVEAMERDGTFDEVILHEIGHVLGIGTLWNFAGNQLYRAGSGQYIGANAVGAFRREVGPVTIDHIPVELHGGPGTADAHWDDTYAEHAGGRDATGRRDEHELMTGALTTPVYMAAFTPISLEDMGFASTVCIDSSDCDTGESCVTYPGCSDPDNCWLPRVCSSAAVDYSAYRCTESANFIAGVRYQQEAQCGPTEEVLQRCKARCDSISQCTGFFYQEHNNNLGCNTSPGGGYQVCGFAVQDYAVERHGHRAGSQVCTRRSPAMCPGQCLGHNRWCHRDSNHRQSCRNCPGGRYHMNWWNSYCNRGF